MAGLSLRKGPRNLNIWERLRVELLLHCIESSQLRWFGHLVRMPPGRHSGEVFWSALGEDSGVDQRQAGGIISLGWIGNVLLGAPPEELV